VNHYPRMLYKYACWDKQHEYHKRLITSPEIYFCSPRLINDPYDCSMRARYDLLTEEEILLRIKYYIKKYNSHLTTPEINKLSLEILNERHFENPENLYELKKLNDDFIYNYNGIFCLSEIRDNLLMWSHYANAHKGFCIGHNILELNKSLTNYLGERTDLTIDLKKIEYTGEYPLCKPDSNDIDNVDYLLRIFEIKYLDWKYEREYRYIMTGSVNRLNNIDEFRKVIIEKEIITEVILGCKMSDDNKKELLSCLKKDYPHTKIYQAIIKKNSFALDFKDITNHK